MKKYIFMLAVACTLLQFSFAQAQVQPQFSFEDGWKIEKFDPVQKIEIKTADVDRQNLESQYQRIKVMEDDLVSFSIDRKSQKIFLHLALDKNPDWTSKEWVPYLKRRSFLIL